MNHSALLAGAAAAAITPMTPSQAQRELLKLDEVIARRQSRASFLQYCRHPDLFPGESPAAHHEFMIDALERVYRGEIKRLMVLMPPGHGKSVYCSQRFSRDIWAIARSTI